MTSIENIRNRLQNPVGGLLYTDVARLRDELLAMEGVEDKDDLIQKADELLEHIQHQIWVQSRECTPAAAEKLVPQIPDEIMLKLSTSPEHEGKPRMLLHTPAFQKRLKEIQTQ